MTILALTLPITRRSAIQIPRRDIVVGAGDTLRLRVRLVEADRPDAAPVDLRRTFARVRMQVWQDARPMHALADYGMGFRGPVISSASAMATAADPDAVEIDVSAEQTYRWFGGGRLGWSLQCAVAGDDTALCWGALNMRPGVGLGPLDVLTDDGAQVLTDTAEEVVI